MKRNRKNKICMIITLLVIAGGLLSVILGQKTEKPDMKVEDLYGNGAEELKDISLDGAAYSYQNYLEYTWEDGKIAKYRMKRGNFAYMMGLSVEENFENGTAKMPSEKEQYKQSKLINAVTEQLRVYDNCLMERYHDKIYIANAEDNSENENSENGNSEEASSYHLKPVTLKQTATSVYVYHENENRFESLIQEDSGSIMAMACGENRIGIVTQKQEDKEQYSLWLLLYDDTGKKLDETCILDRQENILFENKVKLKAENDKFYVVYGNNKKIGNDKETIRQMTKEDFSEEDLEYSYCFMMADSSSGKIQIEKQYNMKYWSDVSTDDIPNSVGEINDFCYADGNVYVIANIGEQTVSYIDERWENVIFKFNEKGIAYIGLTKTDSNYYDLYMIDTNEAYEETEFDCQASKIYAPLPDGTMIHWTQNATRDDSAYRYAYQIDKKGAKKYD